MNPFLIEKQTAGMVSCCGVLSPRRAHFIDCTYIFNVRKGCEVDIFDAGESFEKLSQEEPMETREADTVSAHCLLGNCSFYCVTILVVLESPR